MTKPKDVILHMILIQSVPSKIWIIVEQRLIVWFSLWSVYFSPTCQIFDNVPQCGEMLWKPNKVGWYLGCKILGVFSKWTKFCFEDRWGKSVYKFGRWVCQKGLVKVWCGFDKHCRRGRDFTIFGKSQIFGLLSIHIGDVWMSITYDR